MIQAIAKFTIVLTVPEITFVVNTESQSACPDATNAAVRRSVPAPVTPPNMNTVTTAADTEETTFRSAHPITTPTTLLYHLHLERNPDTNPTSIDTIA